MTIPTLIESLRRKANEDAAAFWQKARADAEAYRAGRNRAAAEQRARAAQALSASSSDFARVANAEAERTARAARASAKAALAGRLYGLAVQALPSFRDDRYAELFAALAAELPSRTWQRVTVNPADEALARSLFSNADVVCDPAIAGGLAAEAEEGRIRVSNTLEARLAAAWPEIVPPLMKEILEELSHS